MTKYDNTKSRRDYENMSRDELVMLIGKDVDPMTTREELIIMAMEVDDTDTI